MENQDELIPLSELISGQKGEVENILGGTGVIGRLNALGVRPGKKIKKISGAFSRGPLVFEIDKTQIAIGHGIAQKILIKTQK
ncbi:ferrous iron transport protein A [Candidatus Peregrinibacteria bacterium]|nr:ferrous iron transport protein A [Candidatus Peregrinibacteria bacterium]